MLSYDHVHEGEDSLVIFAIDEPQERQPVALRLTKNRESFSRELSLRDGVKFNEDFIVPITNVLDATTDEDFAKEIVLKGLPEFLFCYYKSRLCNVLTWETIGNFNLGKTYWTFCVK